MDASNHPSGAFVELKSGVALVAESDLIAFCHQQLAHFGDVLAA